MIIYTLIQTKFEKSCALCIEVSGIIVNHYVICHVHATVPAGKLCLLVNLTNHNHFHSQSDSLEKPRGVIKLLGLRGGHGFII